ncbi:hypothetical protein DYI25_04965 [Mesobacillus boroniphilus]|uniref:Uncharacterized protein n=1 Tax=Mesobacillus boroniphilus TaxID=308892 RepID=A0A944CJ71_9BACI|nr:hypothetical protein [Mesobacillus boroniphilus]
MEYKEHDRTTGILLIILTILLAVSAVVFYPILRMFPHWNIWLFIYGSIQIGFILLFISGVRSIVKRIKVFLVFVNSICVILNSVLIYYYLFPRSIA